MVSLKNCNILDFIQLIQQYEVYCFGCGMQAEAFFHKYGMFHLEEYVSGFIDNNIDKTNEFKKINGKEIPIYSFDQFVKRKNTKTLVLTTSKFCTDMIEQMDKEKQLNGMPCYIDLLIESEYKEQQIRHTQGNKNKIPKIIHYCWFGKRAIPSEFEKYIETWKEKCPDYELMRWDEKNYDIGGCKYIRQAYDVEKWAFVSDYARLDVVYKYGGIYLDTDVELLKNLDDFLYDDMFCGFERNNYVAFGLGFGAIKGHEILGNLLARYHSMDFYEEKLTPCVIYQHEEVMRNGFKATNEYQCKNGVALYPSEVFCPYDLYGLKEHFTKNTYSIHHYSSTWWEKDIESSNLHLRDKLKQYILRVEQSKE